MGFRIIDHINNTVDKVKRVEYQALGMAAQDIEVIVKTAGRTPYKYHGGLHLKTVIRTMPPEQSPSKKWRVIIPLPYAAYQERGRRYDGTHVVKKYTTPGTNKGFFAAAIATTGRNFPNLVKQAARSAGLL